MGLGRERSAAQLHTLAIWPAQAARSLVAGVPFPLPMPHLVEAMRPLSMPCCQRSIVQQAEAHLVIGGCMVAWRTTDAEPSCCCCSTTRCHCCVCFAATGTAVATAACCYCIHQRHGRAGSSQGVVKAGWCGEGGAICRPSTSGLQGGRLRCNAEEQAGSKTWNPHTLHGRCRPSKHPDVAAAPGDAMAM